MRSSGGTTSRAPIGYRNVRKLVGGYETRTVEVDQERADLVRWAFEAYATGAWSLNSLATELEVRGLTFPATAKRQASAVLPKRLQRVLRNRYYLGYVTWRGVEYEGKHPTFIRSETFQLVQQVLDGHRTSGERPSKHDHYLAGSLRCARCKGRLLYTETTGRNGQPYGYFYCASRLNGPHCGLRYLPAAIVERAVGEQWHLEHLAVEDVSLLREALASDAQVFEVLGRTEKESLTRRIHSIKRDRFKWAEKAMDGVVPDDIASEKQRQLAGQLLAAEAQFQRLSNLGKLHHEALDAALSLMDSPGRTYEGADVKLRRALNQAWFDWLWIDEDEIDIRVVQPERTGLTEAISKVQVTRAPSPGHAVAAESGYRCIAQVRGSNVALLVEIQGLKPWTSALPGQRSNQLSYIPMW
jgi:site-specific DNA recombinase